MPTRLAPKWLDTAGSSLGQVLIADGLNGTIVSDITIHDHDNKTLLDTYTQTNEDLISAVTNTHSHSNAVLLESYTQTETDIASAVSLKHNQNQDTGTTNDTFTLYSDTYAISLEVKTTTGDESLIFYNDELEEYAKLYCGDLVFNSMYHNGPNLGFFGSVPIPKAVVTLSNTNDEIGNLTFNSTTYTVNEIEALRDKCESLADDVRAIYNALVNYGLL